MRLKIGSLFGVLLMIAIVGEIIDCGGGGGNDGFSRYAFVVNYGSDDISVYSIDAETGALTWIADIPTGQSPKSIAVDPSGRYAYVANSGDDNVSVYTIGQSNGILAASTFTVLAGTAPYSVDVDPGGGFTCVANYLSNDISVFTIDGSTGALTAGTAVAAGFVNPGYGPHWVTVNPSRQSAYSANYNSNTIFQYSIDSGTGALTPLSSPWVVTGHQPTAIAVDPSGKNAYVTQDSGSLVGDPGTINVYSINGGTGALTFSTTINTGSRPFGIDIHPTGNFAYVANMGADEITVYAIDNVTGMLSTVDTYSCAGTGPMFVVVDPTGSFAYVANYYSNTVAAFAIDQSTGEMTLVVSPVPSGILPRMLAISGEIP